MYKGHQTPLQIYRKIPTIKRNIDDKTFNRALVDRFLLKFCTCYLRHVVHEDSRSLSICKRCAFFLTVLFDQLLLKKEQHSSDANEIQAKLLSFWEKGSRDFVHPARDVVPPSYRVKCEGRSNLQSSSQELC